MIFIGAIEELGRTALRSLLGGRRLRVGADAERGFRVEGLLEIEVEVDGTAAQDPGPGRLVREVAGGAPYDCRLEGSRACSLNGCGRRNHVSARVIIAAPGPRKSSMFTQLLEFSEQSASSKGWHVQWEAVPPGEESGAL
jgi:hypothetical protein